MFASCLFLSMSLSLPVSVLSLLFFLYLSLFLFLSLSFPSQSPLFLCTLDSFQRITGLWRVYQYPDTESTFICTQCSISVPGRWKIERFGISAPFLHGPRFPRFSLLRREPEPVPEKPQRAVTEPSRSGEIRNCFSISYNQ